eukprot:CAMPEP_0179250594 /NCGR_PEP_ID=MMETSP0797-20121207/21249_1 /TAXON_ID=47934 /ORGANISM="Dinophysis acuminata, Strain DAEP01" /LENGTH=48 /DNA_ID= /DNA_START= /DNA_END= /DNA_ORIENTATION=
MSMYLTRFTFLRYLCFAILNLFRCRVTTVRRCTRAGAAAAGVGAGSRR